ncbi:hypothetical protein ACFFX1_04480 [Dactylosporangium sucinum]|uniref:Uncharacterized protein n=1 Tax=Dactylosporangium sucinum TaxID=1424081 RepID=A0A917U5P0_9ACTN|nr:hypothetical protein [Dactylosporangium sucinum]GGM59729.1 hypothetical protein GCM10007977_071610 [Dactylosporangium sucinum]
MDIVSTGEHYLASTVAAFEAAVLVRCTGVCGGGGRARALGGARARSAHALSGVLAEFNRPVAADRLVELLQAAGHSASVHRYTAGNRHRYEISRVFTEPGTDGFLDRAWWRGYAELCGTPDAPRSGRQVRHARLLAEAAWRGVLLVSGPARTGSPGLRVADLDTATVLIRAGRMMRLPVRMSTRPGGQLLLVMPSEAAA